MINTHMIGSSGNPIELSAGLLQYIADMDNISESLKDTINKCLNQGLNSELPVWSEESRIQFTTILYDIFGCV